MRSLILSLAALTVAAGTAGAQQFEPIREIDTTITTPRVRLGGAFTQNFQALEHHNTATPGATTTLGLIRPGFNLAAANLNVEVDVVPGVKVVVENYASSRHHNEFWVKGGYAQIDRSPINLGVLNRVMDYTSLRVGMFEPNYGDAHFRRTDNGLSTRNLFAENLILDSFTTEPGADLTFRYGPLLAVVGATSGENKGNINEDTLVSEKPALLGKVGFNHQLRPNLRVRLTGSTYRISSTPRTTLFSGDRSGSVYHGVMQTQAQLADTKSPFTNGRLSPAFTNSLRAVQINPFVRFGGLELFGVYERAAGKPRAQADDNEIKQWSVEGAYHLGPVYLAARRNVVTGDLSATVQDVESARNTVALGWNVFRGIQLKGEYLTQTYEGWAANHILNGGKFDGFVIQAALTF
jgi:hypothetical protein